MVRLYSICISYLHVTQLNSTLSSRQKTHVYGGKLVIRKLEACGPDALDVIAAVGCWKVSAEDGGRETLGVIALLEAPVNRDPVCVRRNSIVSCSLLE